MKHLSVRTSFLLISVFLACTDSNPGAQISQPNVLLIIIDDLNDYLGSYGGHPQAKTPNIDKLAAAGTVFTNAHTNSPVCSPSRNSMFTGIYPHTSKDFGWTYHIHQAVLKDTKTFIELFRENGYKTVGSGKLLSRNVLDYWDEWGVPERINYGPHAFDGEQPVGHPSVPMPFRGVNFVDGSFGPLSDIPKFDPDGTGPKETGWTYAGTDVFDYVDDENRDLMPDELHARWAAAKIKELERQNTGQPFFMGVGFVKPHTPLYAPEKYFDMFPQDKIQLPVIREGDRDDVFYSTVYPPTEMGLHYYRALKASYPEGNEGLKRIIQAYLACVAFVDEQVGLVMDALDNSKFRDNTIVIFTSDHGWQFGEKDYLYKNSPWEESTRVPLILRTPEAAMPGSEVRHPVSLIDIYPTLIDMCGLDGSTKKVETAPGIEGFSLRPFLRNPDFDAWEGPDGVLTVMGAGINKPIEGLGVRINKTALWHIKILKDLDDAYVMKQNYTYRTKDWRYIRYRNGKEELYHHKDDPNEWKNLALNKGYFEVKEDLKKQMLEIIN
ncbi:MAG: sulfatase [Cytophagales bacterium]|nr:sulfatase [Cytophagales bacterium]